MTLKKILLGVSLITFILLSSCYEETLNPSPTIKPSLDDVSSEMVVFETEEEYNKLMSNVSFETMKEWGESKGFKAFGIVCDEFYRTSDFDKFATFEELKKYVESNNTLIQLVEDEQGELSLETMFADNSERYFANADMMFQVEETVYKIFRGGLAFVAFENLKELKELTQTEFDQLESGRKIGVKRNGRANSNYSENGKILDNSHYSCGNAHTATGVDGNERVRVEIESNAFQTGCAGSTCNGMRIEVRLKIKSQKRTLGIWINAVRTNFANLSLASHARAVGTSTWYELIDYEIFEDNLFSSRENTLYDNFNTGYVALGNPEHHLGGYVLNFGNENIGLNDCPNDERLCNVGVF